PQDQFLAGCIGSPGKAYARLEILVIGIIERAGIAVLAGELDLTGEQSEVRLPILDLHQRRVVLPANSEVQRQVVADAIVILHVEAVDCLALAPCAGAEAAAEIVGKAEDEVGL